MNPKKTRAEHPKRIDISTENSPLGLSLGEFMGQPTPAATPTREAQEAKDAELAAPIGPASRFSRIVLQRTRAGRGGKWATQVLFTPEPTPQQLEALARELRRALGTGAHLEEGVLVVQGDIADRIEAWFQKHGSLKIVR